ncbi:folate-binding protein YgfZ [Legionella israelensis]|uniref:Folate-binding protein YgfZ n=1 Tax=Legionella israelensis TaxID=454 RepID=A0AAX1EG70_9GAMM|nr:folate-binding protein YgfZ [Legionella israelensis]QBR84074.1 folate-binding protein YgfZ [Legionella israelensis]
MIERKEIYSINNRSLSMFFPLTEDITLEKNRNYLFDLSYMRILKVRGEKSAEFLQGQLSCDTNQVTEQTMRQGAMCNLKGRILALLDVFYYQGLNLLLPADLCESTQKSLQKAALFSKVNLEQDSHFNIYGFYYQNPSDLKPCEIPASCSKYQMIQSSDINGYHLGQGLFIFFVSGQQKQVELLESFNNENKQRRSSLAWHRLILSHGFVNIYPETRGLFLPHRLDLHHHGYLNFEKGCYKGQEIIARTHYKAKLKHELKLFTVETSEALFSSQKIFDETRKKEVGELVDYSPVDKEQFLVALSLLVERTNPVWFERHDNPVDIYEYSPP